MGITGLLPLLRPVTKDIHVRELKGLTVGIDTYCWLHKGVYSCSSELCQGIPTNKFIKYCVDRVRLLLSHGVRPYLVFDGGYLPAKAGKEEERRTRRDANLQRAKQLLREGNASGAHQFFSKAADVTPFMAHQLIQVVKRIPGVRYVVAPYEADAQLGFLARNGHVDVVITEDSDVLLFGCARVVFKLERDGTGQEVDLGEVFSRRNDELDMRGMSEDDLLTLCTLSGCDYLPSVPGLGLKKAHRLVARHKQVPKILKAVKFEYARVFPSGYEVEFQRALLTFRHQRAFDPISRTAVHMTPLPESLPGVLTAPGSSPGNSSGGDDGGGDPLDFLGSPIEATKASAVANGDVDPITGQSFVKETARVESRGDGKKVDPSGSSFDALAAWQGVGASTGRCPAGGSSRKLSAQGNNLTKYWGAPMPKNIPIRPSPDDVGTNNLECRSEAVITPERARHVSRTGDCGDGKGAASRGTTPRIAEEEGNTGKPADPGTPSTCVSPFSFYQGSGCDPPQPVDSASRDKENGDPSPRCQSPKANTQQPAAKSKHFGEVNGSRSAAVTPTPAGLRKRFLAPLTTSRSTNGVALRSSVRGSGGSEHPLEVNTNPWETDYACVSQGAGRSGGRLVSSRLKRRRTLGLGSLAPKGVIRGLNGVAAGGWSGETGTSIGFGRRSKSEGGIPRKPDFGARNEKECRSAANSLVDNLFDRFAARPPPTVNVRSEARTTSSYEKDSEGKSEGSTGLENRLPSGHGDVDFGAEKDGGGRGEESSSSSLAGDTPRVSHADALFSGGGHNDKASAERRRFQGQNLSISFKAHGPEGARSATGNRSLQGTIETSVGSRSCEGFRYGQGGDDVDSDHANLNNGQVEKNALLGRSRDDIGMSGVACSEDLFSRFVYAPALDNEPSSGLPVSIS